MSIRLLFFASLRERLGSSGESLELPGHVKTVGDLRAFLASRGEAWQGALDGQRALRMAVNQDLAGADATIKDGDEVAFFPPVTGG
jgi:molybdopterin synthase sulfur carrier subunit